MVYINIYKVYDFDKFRDCFSIKRSSVEDEITFKITVSNKCLKSWHDLKQKSPDLSFVQIINGFLAESYVVLIKEDCARVENLVRTMANRTNTKLSTKRGQAYMVCAKTVKNVTIHSDEVQHVSEIKAELENVTSEKDTLHEYCDELVDNLSNAKADKSQVEEKLKEQININTELQKTQDRLLQYVDEVQELQSMANNGKKISEVGGRQQYRKLKELKSKIEWSVWFARTFGLSLSAVEVKDDAGVYHTYAAGKENTGKSYKDLSEEEGDLVKQTVFITDKFCIGEAAYHELTMVPSGTDLPRSYLLKQCKNDLNIILITRTPGEAEGAQLDFERELANVLRSKVC